MDDEPIVWVPNAQVWREIGKSRQTLHRWDRDPRMAALGWPPPIKPNGNPNGPISRDRRKLETFKRRAMAAGILRLRKDAAAPKVEHERGGDVEKTARGATKDNNHAADNKLSNKPSE